MNTFDLLRNRSNCLSNYPTNKKQQQVINGNQKTKLDTFKENGITENPNTLPSQVIPVGKNYLDPLSRIKELSKLNELKRSISDIYIATLNTGSPRTLEKLMELELAMETIKWDTIRISKMRRFDEGIEDHNGKWKEQKQNFLWKEVGDPVSSKLFSAVLEIVFSNLRWDRNELNINGENLNHLRFVDDIVVFSENPDNLEYIQEEFNENAKIAGTEWTRSANDRIKWKALEEAFVQGQAGKEELVSD
ncbi:hypothetical protein EVAR_46603_1 [Eumeta japonica]|uniref:Reverse transcriptase domain-containing protein n=1 Tax=Eumeta variegata TaxID=151549 RepID=A0A4C1Z9Z1_EUMVA|nr:hypothetical protein EVAR_46603_1 [Eumeta japonica]